MSSNYSHFSSMTWGDNWGRIINQLYLTSLPCLEVHVWKCCCTYFCVHLCLCVNRLVLAQVSYYLLYIHVDLPDFWRDSYTVDKEQRIASTDKQIIRSCIEGWREGHDKIDTYCKKDKEKAGNILMRRWKPTQIAAFFLFLFRPMSHIQTYESFTEFVDFISCLTNTWNVVGRS